MTRMFCGAALVFCRDSGTEILVRDYDAPQIETFTEVRTARRDSDSLAVHTARRDSDSLVDSTADG